MSQVTRGYVNAAPLHPMQWFGPYQLQRALGEGAMSSVYSAVTQDGRQVALKVLSPAAASQPKIRGLFQSEYQIVSLLHHPGIVQVYDAGEINGRPYMAMTLVQGQTLEEFLAKNKTPGETASRSIAQQVATTLDYVHQQGVVHRDLKPANLLIDGGGRVFLFDFGAALNRNLTGTDEEDGIYGTPAFLAPEQIRNSAAIDGRADLYSLGVILYRMVSGRKPFYGSRSEVLEAHLHQPPPRPSEFTYVSPEVEAIILKAMAKAPETRFQTGAEFASALEAAHTVEPPPESTSFPQRILQWFRGHAPAAMADE